MKYIEDRVLSIKGTKRSNCIGTALYLSGEQEEDNFIDPFDVHSHNLVNLPKIDYPGIGTIVAWEEHGSKEDHNIYVGHMGIVIATDPTIIIHRIGTQRHVVIDPLKEAVKFYSSFLYDSELKYYIPSKSEELSEFFRLNNPFDFEALKFINLP